ncbi:MAG TPA: ABC transporter substrate-binding protein [bacterium]|nr:ABC transporter substrate-binding protein [bacterium]
MTRARSCIWAVAITAAALFGTGMPWGPTPAPGAAPASLTFGLSAEPPNLDPHNSAGAAAQTVKMQIYRGLFKLDSRGRIQKDLVASYDQPTPTTYVFHLRPNLKFSDGSPLTAADVVFSFERIADPKVGAYLQKRLAGVESVEALDPQTVKVTLHAPDAVFITLLGLPQAAVVSKTFTLAHNDDLKTVTMGEGPYVLADWQRGVQLTVTRNPNYYGGAVKTPEIRFVFYPDDNSRVAALESGSVDMIEYVPWQAITQIQSNPQFGYQGTDGPFMYLVFNVTQAPFNDVRVRHAIGYAIDRDAIIKTAFFGRGGTIYGLPIAKGNLAYDPAFDHYYTYDPAKAKQLLAEAGFPNGFTATLLSTAQYGMHKDTAQVVQQNLNAIGEHVTLSLPDWPTRVATGNEGRYQFAVMGTVGDYSDPDFLSLFLHSGPTYYAYAAGYNNATMDVLLEQGRAAMDPAKRKSLYAQVQRTALADAPYIFLTYREQGYAYRKGLEGFRLMPGFLAFYSAYEMEGFTVAR